MRAVSAAAAAIEPPRGSDWLGHGYAIPTPPLTHIARRFISGRQRQLPGTLGEIISSSQNNKNILTELFVKCKVKIWKIIL